MNAKPEFLYRIKQIIHSDHYVWIDAGITKIFKHPLPLFQKLSHQLSQKLKTNTILMPGFPNTCKQGLNPLILNRIYWRFCGGFIIVPNNLIETFYVKSMEMNTFLTQKYQVAIWEINVWVLIEDTIPIQLECGNHDNTIFDCVSKYIIQDTKQ